MEKNEEKVETSEPEKKPLNKKLILVGVVVFVIAIGVIILVKSGITHPTPRPTVEGVASEVTEILSPIEETNINFAIEGGSFYFKPNKIEAKKGNKINITFTNKAGVHDFVIDEFNVKTDQIKSGDSTQISFIADKVGTFKFYCSIGNHREAGMTGTLTVN